MTASITELDAEALKRLRELDPGGKGRLVERVLGAFESSSTKLREQLRQARAARDLEQIRHVAHTLKSSSASIGGLALSRICAEIEASVRADRVANLGAQLDAMDRELDGVLQAVTSMLAASSAPNP